MKRILAGLVAASALTAVPAAAQTAPDFGGLRVGAEIGLVDDDFLGSDDTSYGFNVGYDVEQANTVYGVTGSYTGLFDDNGADFRELSIAARGGFKVTPATLAYATAGYSNIDSDFLPGSLDGVKVGLGLEHSFGKVFANVETRYGNYEQGAELYQTVVGVGFRF